jgi:hypothetical protein
MSAVLKQGPDALAGLLAYVAQVRDRRLGEIRDAAARERKALLDAARARAREQLRQALREARHDAEAQVARARAAAQSRLRQARQSLTLAALAGVQARVETAVRARWAAAPSRAAWLAMAFDEAARHLPRGSWDVSHAPGAKIPQSIVPEGVALRVAADPALPAGLRIRSGEAEVDATLAGLLREPSRIAALWLGEFERRRGKP